MGEPVLLVNGIEGLSSAKLTDLLRDAGVLETGQVLEVQVEQIGIGFGMIGEIYRLTLTYDRSSLKAPKTVIAKFPRRAAGSNQVDSASIAVFTNEVNFYRELAPGLLHVPRVWSAWADDVAAGLLLEDLGNWKQGDAVAGCTVEEAEAIIDAIAAIHASQWQRTSGDALAWLPRWLAHAQQRGERVHELVTTIVERFGAAFAPEVRALLPELADWIPPLSQQLEESGTALLHTDLHLDNVLLQLPDVRIVDWQSCLIGPPALDLGMLLGGSLPLSERRRSECDLLERYRRQLVEHGIEPPAFNELFDAYLCALVVVAGGLLGWLARTADSEHVGRERALIDAAFDPGWTFAACVDHAPRLRELASQPRPDASR